MSQAKKTASCQKVKLFSLHGVFESNLASDLQEARLMDVESKINIHIAEQKEEGWEVVSLNSSGCFVCVLFEQLPPKASTLSDQFK